jgi:hypothetical protein
MDSNDPAKMRAFSEVFSTASNKFPDDRLNAHRLSVQASRKAEALQTTAEIVQALEKGSDVTKRLIDLQQEIGAIVQEVGGDSNVYSALNRAQVHTSYNPDSGQWATSVQIQEGEKVTA